MLRFSKWNFKLLPSTTIKFIHEQSVNTRYTRGLNYDDIEYDDEYGKYGGIKYTTVEKGHYYNFIEHDKVIALVEIPKFATTYEYCNNMYTNNLIINKFMSLEQFSKEISDEILIKYIIAYHPLMKYVKDKDELFYMNVVRKRGNVLKYIDKSIQTKNICEAAIKNYYVALEHADFQTEKMCLDVVHQNGCMLGYVKDRTFEVCVAAVKNDEDAMQHVPESMKEDVFREICKL